MADLTIGLDISTSVTGIAIIESRKNFNPNHHVVHWRPIELQKCKTFWKKTDVIRDALIDVREKHAPNVSTIFVEEPMKRFATGMSSAQTVSTLQRMNGIVCYIAYKIWGVEPEYVNVSAARKASGVKVVQTKKDPQQRNAKKQTFDHMLANDLSYIVWPTKRNSQPKDWAFDVVDAYVIAKGGMLLNM